MFYEYSNLFKGNDDELNQIRNIYFIVNKIGIFISTYGISFSRTLECIKWHRDILQGKVLQGKFPNWIRGLRRRISFLLELSLKRRRDFDFKKKKYEKREINRFERIACELFACKISLCI